jgi:hypothetical protein
MRVWVIGHGKPIQHRARLRSALRGLAAELDETDNKTHTRILTEWPDMPIKYFAACIGVSYETGKRLHKKWHEDAKRPVPRATHASASEQAFWLAIAAKETAPK